MARHLSQSEIDRLAAEGAEALRKERAAAAAAPVNLDLSVSLVEPIPLPWRGEVYLVPPVPALDGIRLLRIKRRQEQLQAPEGDADAVLEAWAALFAEALQLFPTLLDPVPAVNPFRSASPAEVGWLLGFFWTCLTNPAAARRLAPMPSGT